MWREVIVLLAGVVHRRSHRCRLAATVLLVLGGAATADEPSICILSVRPQPMMANLGDEYRGIRLGRDRDAIERAIGALENRHDVDLLDTPLREAVALIAQKAGLGIGFDHRALEDMGLDIDATSVTGRFEDVSLRAVLRELLDQLHLAVIFRNERPLVTTADQAERHAVRFFYPVLAGTDIEELVALIERTIAPESWDTVGGLGAIVPVPDQLGTGLIIRQRETVHEEIADLLQGLDAALWSPDQIDDGATPRVVRAYPVADPAVREAAAERLADICNESLPHGADAKATVEVIGESLVVRSTSRPFHVMAAQVLASLQGVDTILFEEEPADPEAGAEAHATRYRKIGWPSTTSGSR